MLSRVRIALGLALICSLMISVMVSAKGGFDYLTITGPGLKDSAQVTDTALTEDFFAFANFYEDRTKPPADPGVGYEILRYYEEGIGARAFDRLHYYPESGFVFYDGIENGESEYDGGWYTANPAIKPIVESALGLQAVQAASPPRTESSAARSQPATSRVRSLPVILIVVASGLAAFTALTLWRRRPAPR